jgi:hypothetical protein
MIKQVSLGIRGFVGLAIAVTAAFGNTAARAEDPTAGAAMTISPPVIVLDNPTERWNRGRSQQIDLTVTVTDSRGNAIPPSRRQPIVLRIYQPRGGPLHPNSATISSASDPRASFSYNGGDFLNPMILTATMGDASATAAIVAENQFGPDDCPSGVGHATIPYGHPMQTLERGFTVDVSAGWGAWHTGVELDTGSTGLVLDRRTLGPLAIGPGKPGSREYYPSGYKIVGNYWLTPVTIAVPDANGTRNR